MGEWRGLAWVAGRRLAQRAWQACRAEEEMREGRRFRTGVAGRRSRGAWRCFGVAGRRILGGGAWRSRGLAAVGRCHKDNHSFKTRHKSNLGGARQIVTNISNS